MDFQWFYFSLSLLCTLSYSLGVFLCSLLDLCTVLRQFGFWFCTCFVMSMLWYLESSWSNLHSFWVLFRCTGKSSVLHLSSAYLRMSSLFGFLSVSYPLLSSTFSHASFSFFVSRECLFVQSLTQLCRMTFFFAFSIYSMRSSSLNVSVIVLVGFISPLSLSSLLLLYLTVLLCLFESHLCYLGILSQLFWFLHYRMSSLLIR